MDEQRLESSARDAAGKVGGAVSDLTAQAQERVEGTIEHGKAILEDAKTSAGAAMGRASAIARDVSTAGSQAAAQASEVIQSTAREVGNQASQAATALYQQGTNAGGYVSRYTAEQPLTALLLAAAFGYALAYMIHRP